MHDVRLAPKPRAWMAAGISIAVLPEVHLCTAKHPQCMAGALHADFSSQLRRPKQHVQSM